MNVLNVIITIVLMVVDIALIVLVLAQHGKTAGLPGAIAGGAETFFGKRKAKSFEGKLALLTKICAAAFIVLSLGMVIIQRFAV